MPLTTYSITVTVSQNGVNEFQFQLSPQNVSGTYLGTLVPNATTQVYATKYISGTLASLANPNTNSWTFTWTAPATGLGPVTFYSSFNAVDGMADTDGDYVYTRALTAPQAGSPLSSITSANVSCYSLCNGTATVNAVCGTSPYTYQWNPGGQTTSTVSGLCAGSYSVLVTDALSSTTTATVIITEPAALTTTMSSTDQTTASPPNGTATANVSGGTGTYTYLWNTAPPQSTQTATGLTSGTYTVIITDTNGCTLTSTVVVNSTVWVVSTDILNSVRVYPNPTTKDFFLELNSLVPEIFTLNITDVTGKTVYYETLQLAKGKNVRQISLAPESQGVFFLQLRAENGVMKVFSIAKYK